MSGGEGFEVDPEELARHAERVQAVAQRVRAAHTAAVQVGGGHWQMYGVLLGGHLARATAYFATRSADGLIDAAADLVEACADGVEDERLCYEELDQQLADLLERMEPAELPPPPEPRYQWG